MKFKEVIERNGLNEAGVKALKRMEEVFKMVVQERKLDKEQKEKVELLYQRNAFYFSLEGEKISKYIVVLPTGDLIMTEDPQGIKVNLVPSYNLN